MRKFFIAISSILLCFSLTFIDVGALTEIGTVELVVNDKEIDLGGGFEYIDSFTLGDTTPGNTAIMVIAYNPLDTLYYYFVFQDGFLTDFNEPVVYSTTPTLKSNTALGKIPSFNSYSFTKPQCYAFYTGNNLIWFDYSNDTWTVSNGITCSSAFIWNDTIIYYYDDDIRAKNLTSNQVLDTLSSRVYDRGTNFNYNALNYSNGLLTFDYSNLDSGGTNHFYQYDFNFLTNKFTNQVTLGSSYRSHSYINNNDYMGKLYFDDYQVIVNSKYSDVDLSLFDYNVVNNYFLNTYIFYSDSMQIVYHSNTDQYFNIADNLADYSITNDFISKSVYNDDTNIITVSLVTGFKVLDTELPTVTIPPIWEYTIPNIDIPSSVSNEVDYTLGFNNGYDSAVIDLYDEIYTVAYSTGFTQGKLTQIETVEQVDNTDYIGALVTTMLSAFAILDVELLPNLKIGYFVVIPLIFGLMSFLFGTGKGSDK